MFINRILSYISATLSSKLSTNLPYGGGGGGRGCVFINRLLSYFSATLSSKLSTNLPYGGGGGVGEGVCS